MYDKSLIALTECRCVCHDQIYGKDYSHVWKEIVSPRWAISRFDRCEQNPKWNFRLSWESPSIQSAWLQTSEGFSEMKSVILHKSLYPLYSHCDPDAEAITAGVTWSWQCQTHHCCSLLPACRTINLQPAGPTLQLLALRMWWVDPWRRVLNEHIVLVSMRFP